MRKTRKMFAVISALLMAANSVSTFTISSSASETVVMPSSHASPEFSNMGATLSDSHIEWHFDGANRALYFNGYNGTGHLTTEIYSEAIESIRADFPVNKIECVIIGNDILIPQNAEGDNAPFNQFFFTETEDILCTYSGSEAEKEYEAFVGQMVDYKKSWTEEQVREEYPLHILADGETYQRNVQEDKCGVYSKGATWQYVGEKRMLYVGGKGSFTSQEFNSSLQNLDLDFVVFGEKVTMCEDDVMERNGESCCRTLFNLTKNIDLWDNGTLMPILYDNNEMINACYDVCNYAVNVYENTDPNQYRFYTLDTNDMAKLSEYEEKGMQLMSDVLIGDINLDGIIDLLDAILLSKMVSGSVTASTTAQLYAADVNQDGTIDTNDSLLLLEFLVHLVDSL